MLFKEIITVYIENHTKFINTKIQRYWFLRCLGDIITNRICFKGLSWWKETMFKPNSWLRKVLWVMTRLLNLHPVLSVSRHLSNILQNILCFNQVWLFQAYWLLPCETFIGFGVSGLLSRVMVWKEVGEDALLQTMSVICLKFLM
jgi:hypothetical protein